VKELSGELIGYPANATSNERVDESQSRLAKTESNCKTKKKGGGRGDAFGGAIIKEDCSTNPY